MTISAHAMGSNHLAATDHNDVMQVRVMPNTPCFIREAASAYVLGNHATPADASRTFALMRSVGTAPGHSNLLAT